MAMFQIFFFVVFWWVRAGALSVSRVAPRMLFENALKSLNPFQPSEAELRQKPNWLSLTKVREYADRVAAIEALAPEMAALTDDELKAKTAEFRGRSLEGETLEELLPEAFAVCREASKRVVGLYHYDVQLCGGIALNEGKLAEMATGEGKTLVATLPLYLRSLDKNRKGAHLITVNDYLARRDAENLGPLYEFLNVSVGVVQASSTTRERRKAYAKDVTYVTNNELGFDYLRDHLAYEMEELTVTAPREGVAQTAQTETPLGFGIVDEADSILIDEARTPLIISAPSEEQQFEAKFEAATDVTNYLKRGDDYEVDKKEKKTTLTEEGYKKACSLLGVSDLFDPESQWLYYLGPSMNAKELYIKDRDYIVNGRGEVVIVDEFTGRIMEGRRWNGGLHQAIEAKEGLKVREEQITAATITYQSLFLLYETLSGMSGTLQTEAAEFSQTYQRIQVVQIPTAKPMRRNDRDDLVYASKLAKFRATIRMISDYHDAGRPVLVGTTTVEDSSLISELLTNQKIPHRVLNARPQVAQRESEIIAQAGRVGAVTIATNMAGRGTDILLGGNAALFARIAARQALAPLVDSQLKPVVDFEKTTKVFPVEPSEGALSRLRDAANSSAQDLKGDILAMELEEQLRWAQQDADEARAEGRTPTSTSSEKKSDKELVMNAADERSRLFARLSAVDEYVAASAAAAAQEKDAEQPNMAAFGRATLAIEEEFAREVQEEREDVRELGGLVVLGTERHESRRIDLQLRGRAGRQGDRGESIFVISLEDKMFNVFGADKMGQLRKAFEFAGDLDEPLSSNLLTNSLSSIQEKVEAFYKDVRTNLFKYDKVTDLQRRQFYFRRKEVVCGDSDFIRSTMKRYCVDTARDVLANVTLSLQKKKGGNNGAPLSVDAAAPAALKELDALELAKAAASQIQLLFPRAAAFVDDAVQATLLSAFEKTGGKSLNIGDLEDAFVGAVTSAVDFQFAEIDAKDLQNTNLVDAVTRFLVVREFDRGWKGHLQTLNFLKETIGYEAFAQKDPFIVWADKSNAAYRKLSADIYRFAAIAFLTLDPETNLVQQEPPPPLTYDDGSQAYDGVYDGSLQGEQTTTTTTQTSSTKKNNNKKQATDSTDPNHQGNRAARRAAKGKKKKTRAL